MALAPILDWGSLGVILPLLDTDDAPHLPPPCPSGAEVWGRRVSIASGDQAPPEQQRVAHWLLSRGVPGREHRPSHPGTHCSVSKTVSKLVDGGKPPETPNQGQFMPKSPPRAHPSFTLKWGKGAPYQAPGAKAQGWSLPRPLALGRGPRCPGSVPMGREVTAQKTSPNPSDLALLLSGPSLSLQAPVPRFSQGPPTPAARPSHPRQRGPPTPGSEALPPPTARPSHPRQRGPPTPSCVALTPVPFLVLGGLSPPCTAQSKPPSRSLPGSQTPRVRPFLPWLCIALQ